MVAISEEQKQVTRFLSAIDLSEKKFKSPRNISRMMLRTYGGELYCPGWAEHSQVNLAEPKAPLNQMYSVPTILIPHLVGNELRAKIVSKSKPELQAFANVFGEQQTMLYKDIMLAETFRKAVMNALFGMGIVKVGLGPTDGWEEMLEKLNYLNDAGQVFAEVISLDDYILDPAARCRQEAAFEGNKYRLPREVALASGLYDRKAIEDMPNISYAQTYGEMKQATIGHTAETKRQMVEFDDLIELMDIWLPRDRVIVTVATGVDKYLAETEVDTPERGPYEVLNFNLMPESPLGVSVMSQVDDLNRLINVLAIKAGDQAVASKTIGVGHIKNREDGDSVKSANDGEFILLNDPQTAKTLTLGGVNPQLYEAVEYYKGNVSSLSGNTDLLGGLGPQSKTLGQDQMLAGSANVRISDMRGRIHSFASRVCGSIAWYSWTDPNINTPIQIDVGGGVSVNEEFSPQRREGNFFEYGFDLTPESFEPQTSGDALQRFIMWKNEFVLPLANLAAQQGWQIDVGKLIEIGGHLARVEQAGQVLIAADPQLQQQQAGEVAAPDQNTTINMGRARQAQGGANMPSAPAPASQESSTIGAK